MKTIEELEEEIRKLRVAQANCNHDWADPVYDPYKEEIMRAVPDIHGSDYYLVPEGTGTYRTVDRWSRTCRKCGKKEYTQKRGTAVIDTGPQFKR